MENEVVRFIYKDGRIIPIRKHVKGAKRHYKRARRRLRTKRHKSSFYKGLGQAGVGVGIGIATGDIAARVVKKSALLKAKAKRGYSFHKASQLSIFGDSPKTAPAARTLYRKQALRARKLFKLRNPILAAGTILSASFLSGGITKMVKSSTGKDYQVAKETGSDVLGAAISTGIGLLYYKRLGVKGIGNLIKQAAARKRNIPRPYHQPIKHRQGTLKF